MFDKIKAYLITFGGLIVAVLTFEFLRRGNKIDSLKDELAGEKASKVGEEIKGRMNEQEKQAKVLETSIEEADARFNASKLEFERLRNKLRNDSKDLHGDGGGGEPGNN